MKDNKHATSDELLIFDEGMMEQRDYWVKKLKNLFTKMSPANIRLDYHRPAGYSPVIESVELNLGDKVWRLLTTLTGDEPFLVYTVLLAALDICLFKYTGTSPVVTGSPALKSEDETISSQPGNVLTMVNDIDDQLSFRQFLMNVRETLLEAYERQDYPFGRLIDNLEIKDVENKCPLFDVALVLKNIHKSLDMQKVMNDIIITCALESGRVSGQVVFSSALFRRESIERFVGHFILLLQAALENTDILISDLQMLTEEERYRVLVTWNDTAVDYPGDKCNHQLFEDHAQQNPDATALVFAHRRLTYRQLDQRANQLARHLQALGVGPDGMVGICVDRSLDLVIGLLGVLKAGGAYVPLDPTYPKKRLATMLEDAELLRVLLTKEHLIDRLPQHKAAVVCLDKNRQVIDRESIKRPDSRATVHNLVYVIFTSGSTGRPKGAAVYQRGWTNLMHWFVTDFNITSLDKVLVISSFSFDITQRSLAMPLIVGAQLHLIASDYYDPQLITRTVFHEKISLLNCSPSTFYPLIEGTDPLTFEKLSSLRVLFLGGEVISASRLRHWVESGLCSTEIANVYGAAECSDVSAFHRLKDYELYIQSSVPAGKPIFNSQVYILDNHLHPVPVGVAGEICLAGDGVGRGYINDEALNDEKFVANPFNTDPGARLYRTGDLGRFLPDGTLEFIGRVDHQVKVRGFRIDLGDIEAALRQHVTVKEAVVVDREYSKWDQRLISYIVPDPSDYTGDNREQLIESLNVFLKEKLPPYMVPGAFVILEKLPLNPNGKVDRDALPDPETAVSGIKVGSEGPRTPLEEDIADVFAEFLKLEKVGIFDNFFELGGHSLLATQVISRLNEALQLEITQTDLLVGPTVAGLAGRVESMGTDE